MDSLPMGLCRRPCHFAIDKAFADGFLSFADDGQPSAKGATPVVQGTKEVE
jgi:hypothetical protein